jgi:hypothetical protein
VSLPSASLLLSRLSEFRVLSLIRQDLLVRSSRGEQLKHIRNTDAQPTNAGASSALAGFDGDSIEAIQIHRISCNFDNTHTQCKARARWGRLFQMGAHSAGQGQTRN